MVKLILLRHALTVDNQENRLSGHVDSKVSEEGKLQIEKVTEFLEGINIDKIYTTTSSRTKDTVKNISKIKGIGIEEVELLKEISFGDFEGITFEEIKSKHQEEFNKMISEGYEYRYPNGESLIDSYNRVSKKVDEIVKTNEDKTILICSHGGTIRNIISHLIGKTHNFHWNFRIDNASISILEIQDGFTVVNTLNNTQYINSK